MTVRTPLCIVIFDLRSTQRKFTATGLRGGSSAVLRAPVAVQDAERTLRPGERAALNRQNCVRRSGLLFSASSR